ncbi:hypothetical protein Q5H93_05110 [Hymenobacter sp. ASUV-10]|uniref:STAS/SEC14 domain-containing protein n=1 Tax=Hymenobacter aranciens TaxID=3063996 RepID=A0ABT9B8W3_9BACT|nr:hypothetical protein [Hymenobacter sp. ASUV-10]MDO7874103.1 hypothetical protein [Hymenobacter sp. ASUV-10]
MRTVLSFPYLEVNLHEGPIPTLETHWLGFAPSADFRSAIEQAVEIARQHRVLGWIADDRQLGAVRPRDLEWTHDEVLLVLENLGLRRFALLESEDALNRRTIAGMYERAMPAISYEIRRFDDLTAARAWAAGE